MVSGSHASTPLGPTITPTCTHFSCPPLPCPPPPPAARGCEKLVCAAERRGDEWPGPSVWGQSGSPPAPAQRGEGAVPGWPGAAAELDSLVLKAEQTLGPVGVSVGTGPRGPLAPHPTALLAPSSRPPSGFLPQYFPTGPGCCSQPSASVFRNGGGGGDPSSRPGGREEGQEDIGKGWDPQATRSRCRHLPCSSWARPLPGVPSPVLGGFPRGREERRRRRKGWAGSKEARGPAGRQRPPRTS